jgi:hypothetical protein
MPEVICKAVRRKYMLASMAEEVAWGNVMWFALCGWQARGDHGRTFNADIFMCVQFQLLFNPFDSNAEQCASCHVSSLLTHARPSLG